MAMHRWARGGGLEPPTTGPEPVVLPITPPPKGPSSVAVSASSGAVGGPCEPAEAEHLPERDPDGLGAVAEELLGTVDRAAARRRRAGIEAELLGDEPDAQRVE